MKKIDFSEFELKNSKRPRFSVVVGKSLLKTNATTPQMDAE